jgi:acylphosphatase
LRKEEVAMKVCKRVLFQGHVQGVGFRYATQRLAQRSAVAGYVKNLADGRVELVAEGAPAEVGRFVEGVARQMAEYIETREEHDESVQGFATFDIQA